MDSFAREEIRNLRIALSVAKRELQELKKAAQAVVDAPLFDGTSPGMTYAVRVLADVLKQRPDI